MLGVIKRLFTKAEPVRVDVVSEEEANATLVNPAFREILSFSSMFEDIKNETDINLVDYNSLDDYMFAYYSTFDTETLKEFKSVLASNPKELHDGILEVVLKARLPTTTMLSVSI